MSDATLRARHARWCPRPRASGPDRAEAGRRARGLRLHRRRASTQALRDALRRGELDVAVHAYKEVPIAGVRRHRRRGRPETRRRAGRAVRPRRTHSRRPAAGRPRRNGSARRRAQLLGRRPDLDVVQIAERHRDASRAGSASTSTRSCSLPPASTGSTTRPRHGIPRHRRLADDARAGRARGRGAAGRGEVRLEARPQAEPARGRSGARHPGPARGEQLGADRGARHPG